MPGKTEDKHNTRQLRNMVDALRDVLGMRPLYGKERASTYKLEVADPVSASVHGTLMTLDDGHTGSTHTQQKGMMR